MTPEQAKEVYRSAWASWLLTSDQTLKEELEKVMDSMQPRIARGPRDPAWKEFARSLPGFLEFWGRPPRQILALMHKEPKGER